MYTKKWEDDQGNKGFLHPNQNYRYLENPTEVHGMELFPTAYQFQDKKYPDPDFKNKLDIYKTRKSMGIPGKENPKPKQQDIIEPDPKRKHLQVYLLNYLRYES